MLLRSLTSQLARQHSLSNERSVRQCSTPTQSRGFVQHPFLVILIFVFSVAAFLAYQHWQATDGTMRGDTRLVELSGDGAGAENTSRNESSDDDIEDAQSSNGARSFFARLFGEGEGEGEDDDATTPLIEQVYAVPQYSSAEHVEWVETFFTELYSPDEAAEVAAPAEEVVPVISGRVLTQHGMPVEGIEVTAVFRDYLKTADSIARKNAVGTQKTTTNEDGFYAFRGLPEGIYMVGTNDSGYYAGARSEVRTGVKYADLVLNAQQYAQVRGVVTDPMGNPIKGVQIMPLVEGVPEDAVSDAEGAFALAVKLQQDLQGFSARFQASGFRETRYKVTESDWTPGGDTLVKVVMEPVYESAAVSGRVTDTDGMPVAGEIVRLYSSSLRRFYRAVADDSGEFEFSNVEIVDDLQLLVRPSGPYKDFSKGSLRIGEGSLRHEVELEAVAAGNELSGTIVDMDAKPVPHFSMILQSESSSGSAVRVTTDQYGDFHVENVPQGPVVFRSNTIPHFVISGMQISGDEFGRQVSLVLNRGSHKLVGRVVGSDGRPVGNPRVSISSSRMVEGVKSRLSSSTSADTDGRFVFTDLGAGQHTITVNAPGYETASMRPVVGSKNEIVVRLETSST